MKRTASTISKLSSLALICLLSATQARAQARIGRPLGRGIAFSFVGQSIDAPPDLSIEVGYLTSATQLGNLFSGPDRSEATALLTYYAELRTTGTFQSGPLTVIERSGTRTVYVNSDPHASFSDPASFKQGEAVLITEVDERFVLDSRKQSFTVFGSEDVTFVAPFEKDGRTYRLGAVGSEFQISEQGAINTTGPPAGYMAGRAVTVPDNSGGLNPPRRAPPDLGGNPHD
jgi:hypothetical protein